MDDIYKYLLSVLLILAFVATVDIVCDANSQLVSPVKFGSNFEVPQNVFIQNAKIGNNFKCGSFCVIGGGTEEVVIGNNVTLGDFVKVSPGTTILDGAKIEDRQNVSGVAE